MLLQLDSPAAKRSSGHPEATQKIGESYPPPKKQEKTQTDDNAMVAKCAACNEPAYGFMVVLILGDSL